MSGAADFRLLNDWQRGFPLAARPFEEIARASGLTEQAVLDGFRQLRSSGMIDRIGPLFRPNTVGASSLAAIAVPPERLDGVAALLNRHPGVSHNYEREHRCNLWFVAAESTPAALHATLSSIERESGFAVLRLPLVEEYHIDLGFDLASHAVPRGAALRVAPPALDATQKALVAALASGLPLVERPYAGFGMPEADVIGLLRGWLETGVVRRVGAVVRHRPLGYHANAMVVWDLPDAHAADAGRRLAADPAVTLCYRRARALPEWPYNLYCMVHGRERAQVSGEIERMRAAHRLEPAPHAVLFSVRCFGQRGASYADRPARDNAPAQMPGSPAPGRAPASATMGVSGG